MSLIFLKSGKRIGLVFFLSYSNFQLISILRKTLIILFIFFISIKEIKATTEIIAPGSFIINMGVMPQTLANGLKPYGLIYDLVKNYSVPIKWVINPSKLKDGIDFNHNGIDYRGGAFIVPAIFRTTAVNARITYWQGLGVVGSTTVSPITVNVFETIRAMPKWTLDSQNGGIAESYLINAGIPTTAYNWLAPAALTCCNDLFIMPHADPKWPTHGNLYNWNLNCDGAIWLACHAGSALEDLFNPANKSQQMNFLSNKSGNAVGTGPYEENALILWGNHGDGSPPYNYSYPVDPIMQFMGIIDVATQNGSESIYLPKVSWRAGAKVYVWDPTHADVPSKSPGPAGLVVSGRAFDDPERGRVMLEAGHSHNKSTAPANVAAQRIFLNYSFWAMNEKAILPTISVPSDTLYSGINNTITFSLPPGINSTDYVILWSASCGGTFSSVSQPTVIFTPSAAPFPTTCFVKVTITDACGRIFTDVKAITVGCNMQTVPTIVNPDCYGGSSGSILLTSTNGVAPYTWNWSRAIPSGTGMGSGTLISGLSLGIYNITVTSANGCTNSLSANITQPASLSLASSVTDILCNGAPTGAINLSVTGGTPDYTYDWGGGITTPNRINIVAGTYIVTVTDSKGCISTLSSIVSQSPAISIVANPINVNCFGGNSGSISLSVSGGIGTKTFLWSTGANTQNISSLIAGTYSVTVTDANNCTKTSTVSINQPSDAINLSASMMNVTCNGGNNGSIDLTVTGGTLPYSYSWSNNATTQDINNLILGTYQVTVTDNNLCSAVLSKIITQPVGLNLSVNILQATCPDDANAAVDLSVNGGLTPYTYLWSNGATTQDLIGILPGSYIVTVTDANNCTKNITANVNSINSFPPSPTVIQH